MDTQTQGRWVMMILGALSTLFVFILFRNILRMWQRFAAHQAQRCLKQGQVARAMKWRKHSGQLSGYQR